MPAEARSGRSVRIRLRARGRRWSELRRVATRWRDGAAVGRWRFGMPHDPMSRHRHVAVLGVQRQDPEATLSSQASRIGRLLGNVTRSILLSTSICGDQLPSDGPAPPRGDAPGDAPSRRRAEPPLRRVEPGSARGWRRRGSAMPLASMMTWDGGCRSRIDHKPVIGFAADLAADAAGGERDGVAVSGGVRSPAIRCLPKSLLTSTAIRQPSATAAPDLSESVVLRTGSRR